MIVESKPKSTLNHLYCTPAVVNVPEFLRTDKWVILVDPNIPEDTVGTQGPLLTEVYFSNTKDMMLRVKELESKQDAFLLAHPDLSEAQRKEYLTWVKDVVHYITVIQHRLKKTMKDPSSVEVKICFRPPIDDNGYPLSKK